jgi:hypothetical protein
MTIIDIWSAILGGLAVAAAVHLLQRHADRRRLVPARESLARSRAMLDEIRALLNRAVT